MSAATDLQPVAEVLAVVAALRLPQGALTDDEKLALDIAGTVVDVATTFGTGHDATAVAVLGLLTQVPRVAELVAGFLATLRDIEARADELVLEVGGLGPGVVVEAG